MGEDSTAALWWAVAGLGAYHGLNPAMGWPLAVANGLSERRAACSPTATGVKVWCAI